MQAIALDEQQRGGQAVDGPVVGPTDEEIFVALADPLRRYAAVVGSAQIEPDDLVQDALAATLRVHRLSDLDNPLAYLRRAVLTSAIAQQKRRSTGLRLLPRLADNNDAFDVYPSDAAGQLEALDPADRALLYLVHVEGLSYGEAGDYVDLTADNARVRASRARAALRLVIEDERRIDE